MALSHRALSLFSWFIVFAMLVSLFAIELRFIGRQNHFLTDQNDPQYDAFTGIYRNWSFYRYTWPGFFRSLFTSVAFAGASFFLALLCMYPVAAIKPKLWSALATTYTLLFLVWFVTAIISISIDKRYQHLINWNSNQGCNVVPNYLYSSAACSYGYWWNIYYRFCIASLIVVPIFTALALYSGHITCRKSYVVKREVPANVQQPVVVV